MNINFYKLRLPFIIISLLIILFGVWLYTGKNFIKDKNVNLGIFTPKGFNYGIDFQGGLIHQVTVYSGISIDEIRAFALSSGLGNEVQSVLFDKNKQIGNMSSFLIKTILTEADNEIIDKDPSLTPAKYLNERIDKFYKLIIEKTGKEKYVFEGEELALANKLYPDQMTGEITDEKTDAKRVVNNIVKESENVISPLYSKGLRFQAILLILFVLGIMLVYITFRFKINYAVGATAALAHDVLIMLGYISFLQLEFDYTIIAAILFIIGYSINDTIVIFDRVRENYTILKDYSPLQVVNISINQTLSRTIITTLTTFLANLALFLWGGDKIHGFSSALMAGMISGTYSTLFIAAPVVDLWDMIFLKKKKGFEFKKPQEIETKIENKQISNIEGAELINEEKTGPIQQAGNAQKIALSKKQLKKLTGGKKKK